MRLLAIWMVCLLPASTARLPARPPAVRHLSTAGTVWINGAALPSGSSLYNGDTLATAENGFAMITGDGQGRVEVRPDSLVGMGQREITLRGGVVGSEGLAVQLGADRIRTASKADSRPWFVVADRGGRKLVAAYQGAVEIVRDGAEPVLVPEGFFAVPAGMPATGPSGDPGDDNSSSPPQPAGGSPSSGPGSAWTIFSLDSAASVAFVVSLGATAAFAAFLGYTLGERSVSPSN
jgi:hypothetical protein